LRLKSTETNNAKQQGSRDFGEHRNLRRQINAATRKWQQSFEVAAQVMELTEYVDACQIATVALEVANISEPMREACAEAFDSWLSLCRLGSWKLGLKISAHLNSPSNCSAPLKVPSYSAELFAVQSPCTSQDSLRQRLFGMRCRRNPFGSDARLGDQTANRLSYPLRQSAGE
jgi:hypothetical protein